MENINESKTGHSALKVKLSKRKYINLENTVKRIRQCFQAVQARVFEKWKIKKKKHLIIKM